MSSHTTDTLSKNVAAVLDSYPERVRSKLLYVRRLIYQTAAEFEEIGPLEETLKWGEPSYLTPQTKSGSTIRIDWKEKQPEQYSIFFKCTANLVPSFKERFPDTFRYGGDRSIDFMMDDDIPVAPLKQCIALALTYHLNKKLEAANRWEMVERVSQ
jgi:hypothetical protein